MGIYLVEIGECDHNTYEAFVIVAESEARAKDMAIYKVGGRFQNAEVNRVGMADEAVERIVFGSYNVD